MAELSRASISYFMSNFEKDFARANRYLITLSLPLGVDFSKTGGTMDSTNWFDENVWIENIGKVKAKENLITVSCSSMTLPGKSLNQNYNYQYNTKWVSSYSTELISFSFYESENLMARKYFEIWLNSVVNYNNTLNFYDEYISPNCVINQLKRNEFDSSYIVKLEEAFPVSIAPIEYSMSNENQVVQSMVTLAFKNWVSENNEFKY